MNQKEAITTHIMDMLMKKVSNYKESELLILPS